MRFGSVQEAGTDSVLFDDEFQWFYEGRNGWWQYDQRTSVEIEKHHKVTSGKYRGQQNILTNGKQIKRKLILFSNVKDGDKRCELLIAGFLYIVDFEHMFQYR